VVLTVEDSGAGLDEATRARIFEPFFTTKFTGRGLGLAAVLGIVRGHGSGLALTSTPGVGSTFTVFFQPSSAPVRVPARETEPTTVPWRGQGTVLVADDDPSVRDIAARHLRRMGFTTLIASNGEAAVEMFQTHRDEIVCVLLDRTMPKIDGIAAAQAIWMVDSSMPIVMMSGYNEAEGRSSPPTDRLGGFLHKPFTIDQLREMLRRTLGG
jgi:CheY-like chemotaxis protein